MVLKLECPHWQCKQVNHFLQHVLRHSSSSSLSACLVPFQPVNMQLEGPADVRIWLTLIKQMGIILAQHQGTKSSPLLLVYCSSVTSMTRANAMDVQVAVCQAESGVIAALKYKFCPNMDAVMLTKLMHIVTTVTTCMYTLSGGDHH